MEKREVKDRGEAGTAPLNSALSAAQGDMKNFQFVEMFLACWGKNYEYVNMENIFKI